MSYVKVAELSELQPERPFAVALQGTSLLLVRQDGEVFALADTCTHEEARLSGGFVDAGCIECPRHGAQFDLRTGEPLTLPAVRPLRTYRVKIEGSQVLVDLAGPHAAKESR